MFLRQHFSGSYFFRDPNPTFEITLAVCTMFYLEFDPHYPHGDDTRSDRKTPRLLKRINDFFGEEEGTLLFKPF